MARALAFVVVIVISACGNGGTAGAPDGTTPLPTLPEDEADMLALLPDAVLHGSEQQTGGPCLWLELEDGKRLSVLWPYGYRAAVDPIRVIDTEGKTVATVGDRVELGGGSTDRKPDRCDVGESTFAVGSVRILDHASEPTAPPTTADS